MEIGVIITTFNRSKYLQECLESIDRSDIPKDSILIIDDASTDEETRSLIHNSYCKYIIKPVRKGIKDSLIIGYEYFFENGYDLVINLDADAIVCNNFLQTILKLKSQFPNNIVSGFNTTVKNRNPIIEEHESYYLKKYASGINMCINREQYERYLLPALKKQVGNWDWDCSQLHMADGKQVIVAKPSVVNHIGFDSAMGHATTEPMDEAKDFKPLHLPMVTLVGVTGNDYDNLLKSAAISTKYIEFGAVKMINLPHINSKQAYNIFVLKELVNYIDTPYFLIIQPDSYVVNWKAWTNEFLKVDVIGAQWEWYKDGMNCGNGGFSIRSKRLHEILRDDETIVPANASGTKNYEEDNCIGRIYRKYLEEKYNIKYASNEICNRFSIEAWSVQPPNNKYKGSFGFHSIWVDFNDSDLEFVPYKYPNLGGKIYYTSKI